MFYYFYISNKAFVQIFLNILLLSLFFNMHIKKIDFKVADVLFFIYLLFFKNDFFIISLYHKLVF